jgi:hypothetical protein
MLPTVLQFALVFSYAAVALWSAVNSVFEHPDGQFDMREIMVITIVSLFWIAFYFAALLLIAWRSLVPARVPTSRKRVH